MGGCTCPKSHGMEGIQNPCTNYAFYCLGRVQYGNNGIFFTVIPLVTALPYIFSAVHIMNKKSINAQRIGVFAPILVTGGFLLSAFLASKL